MDPIGFLIITSVLKCLPWAGLALFVWLIKSAVNSKWMSGQRSFVQKSLGFVILICGVWTYSWLSDCSRLAQKALEPLGNSDSAYAKRLIKEVEDERAEAPDPSENVR